jgi:hypothetical protein
VSGSVISPEREETTLAAHVDVDAASNRRPNRTGVDFMILLRGGAKP